MSKVAILAWERPDKGRALTGVGVYLGYLAELGKFSRNKGQRLELTFIIPWDEDSFLHEEAYDISLIKTYGFTRENPYQRDALYRSSESFADRLLSEESPINLEQFDLVLVTSFAFGYLISKAQNLDNIIYISHRPEFLRGSFMERAEAPDEFRERLLRDSELESKAIRGSKKILAVGESCKTELVKHYKLSQEDISVIYNGIDTSLFRRFNSSRNRNKTIFSYVGRNDHEKGLFLLLNAFRDLIYRFNINNFELHIITNLNPSLIREIAKKGLSNYVKFIGWKNYRDLPQYYSRSTFTIVPSYWESFSYVTAESLSCCTPVIASKAGELSIIINSSNGLSFQTGDRDDLTDTLRKACSLDGESVEEMGRQGRCKMVNTYSKEIFLKNYMRFIEENINGSSYNQNHYKEYS